MLKILHHNVYNCTLHRPSHREEEAAIKFGGKRALRWRGLHRGQAEAQSTTQREGLWQVCAAETATLASASCFPSFHCSQTYPTWGPTPTKSCSFRPRCSTPASLKPFSEWTGSMTGLCLCEEHMNTH